MNKLKTTSWFLRISRVLLVVFTIVLILVIPQLNMNEYVLPTITTKTIYFLYGSVILLGLYTLTIIFSKKIAFSFTKIDIALFVLLFYITLNRYFIQSHYGFSIRYIELLGLSFFYVVLRTICLKNYHYLLLAIVVSGIIQAIYGNLQLLGYYSSNHSVFKMTGSFFNPGPYAGFLVSVWTVALGMYLFKDTVIMQVQSNEKSNSQFINIVIKYSFEYIPLLGVISIAIVFPSLQSRASWIAAMVSSGILLELKYSFLKKVLQKVTTRFQKIALVSILLIIICVGLFSLYHYKKASSDGRAFIWKITTEMITDNPVFGVGFDRFKATYMNYQANYFAKNGETPEALIADNVYYAFNEGIQFVSENGFIGLVLLLILLYILFRGKLNKEHHTMCFIVKTGLLTVGIFACFSYPMQILPIKLTLVFLLALLSNSSVNIYKLNIGYSEGNLESYKIVFLLVNSVIAYQVFFYTNTLEQGFKTWSTALTCYHYGDYRNAIVNFEAAYPIFNREADFLMNYGKTLSLTRDPKAVKILEKAQYYQNNTVIAAALGDSYKNTKHYIKAEVCYKQAVNMVPSKFYSNYLLAKLYNDSGQKDKALTIANKLINKKIKIPSTAIEEIHEEMEAILKKYKNPPGF